MYFAPAKHPSIDRHRVKTMSDLSKTLLAYPAVAAGFRCWRGPGIGLLALLCALAVAWTAFGETAQSSLPAVEPQTVGPVANLTATADGQETGAVQLTWSEAENAQVHFVVYLKTAELHASNFGSARMAPFAGSQGVVSGLEGGPSYSFIIIGMRWNWVEYGTVWGSWSDWASATPGGSASATSTASAAEPQSVGPTTNLTASADEQESGTVRLTWSEAENAQVHFVVYVKSAELSAGNYGSALMAPFAGSQGVVSGLEGGTSYSFIVIGMRWNWAEYGPVWGSWSDWTTEVPADQLLNTIVFGYPNWESVRIQTRIAQYVVEKGYGYPTATTDGAAVPLINALRRGDVDVLMEFWLPRQQEVWNEIQQDGSALSLGEGLGPHWQSTFVIPAYLQRQHPDLDSVEDLKLPQYKSLFATATTGGKARLVSCVRGWECEIDNAAQVEGYGLSNHVEIFNPASGPALDADLLDAYSNREPWLGFQWATNEIALRLDLVRLSEPPYSNECWSTTKACAYEDATILIASNSDLPSSVPDVAAMLRRWDFDVDTVYKDIARWRFENSHADINATALWWLNNRSSIWSQWVTDNTAASIRTALGNGEIPEGWE